MNFFKNLTNDLLRLEINTVFKEELTMEKPRNIRFVLLSLANQYRLKLNEFEGYAYRIDPNFEGFVFQNKLGGKASYKEIITHAEKLQAFFKLHLEHVQDKNAASTLKGFLSMLTRIRKQSFSILDVFKELAAENQTPQRGEVDNEYEVGEFDDLPELELDPAQTLVIRKAKEIGTQRVVMQTVVQVEGDITSYVTSKFLEMDEEDQRIVSEVHNSAMMTSIRMWQYLFETVKTLAGSAFSAATGGKKGKVK